MYQLGAIAPHKVVSPVPCAGNLKWTAKYRRTTGKCVVTVYGGSERGCEGAKSLTDSSRPDADTVTKVVAAIKNAPWGSASVFSMGVDAAVLVDLVSCS